MISSNLKNKKSSGFFFSLSPQKRRGKKKNFAPTHKNKNLPLFRGIAPRKARLPQRVAMDDLASYFVEERSKVR